ncbi:MAG: hydrogen peroxide-inducible genes activator, partial [Duodenibacillus sp.]|nr:hydrogen peroxide-inducible genes activator [Duodenibacillus sp.]
QPLFEEDFVAAVPASHPLASRHEVTSADICREKMLILGPGHCLSDQIVRFLGEARSSQAVKRTEGSSLQTICCMVAQGLGVTMLPASAAPFLADSSMIRVLPFSRGESPHRRMALIWRKSFPREAAIAALKEGVSQLQLHGCYMLTNLKPASLS